MSINARDYMAGERVIIGWKDRTHDWHYFVVMDTRRHGWLKLKGRNDPCTNQKHDGSMFWAHVSEMDLVTPYE